MAGLIICGGLHGGVIQWIVVVLIVHRRVVIVLGLMLHRGKVVAAIFIGLLMVILHGLLFSF